jgi:hypothetical protein
MSAISAGLLRVVPPADYEAALRAQDEQRVAAEQAALSADSMSDLAGYITTQFEVMRNHRNTMQAGWSNRLLSALRAFNGEYEPSKLQEIRKFGGSEVYARLVAMKCRGASSLLRDVYLAPDRPWGIAPTPDPEIPQTIVDSVTMLVQVEVQNQAMMGGQPPDANAIRDRTLQLMGAARQAAKKRATDQAQVAEEKIDEMLIAGGFYKALSEFITDLPLFPFACIKGPVVRIVPQVTWQEGQAVITQEPKLFWNRVSPFDIWWTPGVSDIEDAAVIEKTRVTRADLNDLLDLPGYNTQAIRTVLDDYGRGGLADNWDSTDSERAIMESRENPQMNRSGMITCLEFHGNVQGRVLLENGMDESQIPDPLRDYFVQAWMIGQYIIKVQMAPSPRKRHPYFITSFEKVPGTPVGNGLPDILSDIQEVANASLRSLVNNLSIASGPQVIVNDDRLSPDEDGEQLYPWKRWHVQSDPMGNNGQAPIDFFQPNSNAQELLAVYTAFNNLADELSAIPRYMQGQNAGGAGRTASGLAMLMGNASKILQTVAANIDRDVLEPLLQQLFDMLMLTDQSGFLTGEEEIKVLGVNVAVQRETQRARQLEFLQITANPIDAQLVGPKGRAEVLRAVSQTIGLDGEKIVPTDDELNTMQRQQAAMQQQQQAAAQAQGAQAPKGGNATQDMGPRTNIAGGVQ